MAPLRQPYVSFWQQYKVTILAIAAIGALALGGLYARGGVLDLRLFRAVNLGWATAPLDTLGSVGYALGTWWFSAGLFIALFLLGYRRFAASALGAIVFGGMLILFIKYLTRQPRPADLLPGVRLAPLFELGPAYPSGHAYQAFLTALLLAAYFQPRWYLQAALYALAAFIALSRVYIGEHLPVDIAVGAPIGLLAGVLWTHSRLWPGPRGREREAS